MGQGSRGRRVRIAGDGLHGFTHCRGVLLEPSYGSSPLQKPAMYEVH